MKPLARWTIGPVEPIGYDILRYSIKRFQRLYPEFDCIVCHNNIGLDKLKGIECDLLDQQHVDLTFNPAPPDDDYTERSGGMRGSGWKLVPPRLRLESHELWIDNDIVITDRVPEIDRWLKTSTSIISEGLGQHYGKFHSRMGDLKLCAGFFGLPPNYDFRQRIAELQGNAVLGGFDEQGLVAYVTSQIEDFIIVPQDHIKIVEDHHEFPQKRPMGFHFVGANRKNWHRGWKTFQNLLFTS